MGKFLFELMGFIGKLAMQTGALLFIFGIIGQSIGIIGQSNDLVVTGFLIVLGGLCIYGWYRHEL